MSVLEMISTDTIPLDGLLDPIDAFVARKIDLGDLVTTLSAQTDDLSAVPPKWRAVFLNLCASLEIIHTETRVHRRDLTEMELRFVLALSLQLRQMVVAPHGTLAEPFAALTTL